jgi:hypothetical protein
MLVTKLISVFGIKEYAYKMVGLIFLFKCPGFENNTKSNQRLFTMEIQLNYAHFSRDYFLNIRSTSTTSVIALSILMKDPLLKASSD